jgi:hypothetical protein
MNHLDYARPAPRRPVSEFRAAVPGAVTKLVVAVLLLGWAVFFLMGNLAAVEGHLPFSPGFAAFQWSAWRSQPGAAAGWMQRDAVLPLTFRTLHYVQVTDDGGATVQTVRYDVEIRWGRTATALALTPLVPVIVYFGLRRVVR